MLCAMVFGRSLNYSMRRSAVHVVGSHKYVAFDLPINGGKEL